MNALKPAEFGWPLNRLPEALDELFRFHAGRRGSCAAPRSADEVGEWLRQAAKQAGCEAEPLETTLGELETELAAASPALLKISDDSYLAVIAGNKTTLRVLTPALEQKRVSLSHVCDAIRAPTEAPHRQTLETLLTQARVRPSKRAKALKLLLDEQLCRHRLAGCWTLRSEPGGKPLRLLKEAGTVGNAAGMIVAHSVHYLLWVTSWIILGDLTTAGHMDRAWIFAWALLLITIVPCQVATTWLQGMFAIGLGGFLKRRLLVGAMKLRPEEMRRSGIGSFLGQALEAEAVETLALSGGIAGLLATIEILMAIAVLGRFAWVLAGWTLLAGWVAWRFLRRYEGWTSTRMVLTEDLIESMVGHRTRLAQLDRNEWHEGEDQALTGYLGRLKVTGRNRRVADRRHSAGMVAGRPRMSHTVDCRRAQRRASNCRDHGRSVIGLFSSPKVDSFVRRHRGSLGRLQKYRSSVSGGCEARIARRSGGCGDDAEAIGRATIQKSNRSRPLKLSVSKRRSSSRALRVTDCLGGRSHSARRSLGRRQNNIRFTARRLEATRIGTAVGSWSRSPDSG